MLQKLFYIFSLYTLFVSPTVIGSWIVWRVISGYWRLKIEYLIGLFSVPVIYVILKQIVEHSGRSLSNAILEIFFIAVVSGLMFLCKITSKESWLINKRNEYILYLILVNAFTIAVVFVMPSLPE